MHEIPSSLEEMQHWFAGLITSPILQSDADQIPLFPPDVIPEIRKKIASSPTLRSEERLGIYRQQYWWRLISVMQELFPSLVALLDYEEFNRLIAEPYLSSHIPQDWFISNIGSDLPEWLKTSNLKNELPLSELAKLDLAYEQLLFAEILPNIDLLSAKKKLSIYSLSYCFSNWMPIYSPLESNCYKRKSTSSIKKMEKKKISGSLSPAQRKFFRRNSAHFFRVAFPIAKRGQIERDHSFT